MHPKRLSFIFALFLFAAFATSASAQLVHSAIAMKPGARPAVQKVSSKSGMHELSVPISIHAVESNVLTVNNNQPTTFEDSIINTSSQTLNVYFDRSQNNMPLGWTSSLCWGAECYSDTRDTASWPIAPGAFGDLILHVNPMFDDKPDTATVLLQIFATGSLDTQVLPYTVYFVPNNPPLVFDWPQGLITDSTFTGAGSHVVSNWFENDLASADQYTFYFRDSLPEGWSVTACVGKSYCTTESGTKLTDSLKVNFGGFGQSPYQEKINFTVTTTPTVSGKDSAVVYLSVHPKTAITADSAEYRFAIGVQSASGVSEQSANAGLAVTNAWPNPLHPSNALHLEIMADVAGPATANVYNLDGNLKSSLELGELQSGTNELQLSLPDALPSGEYIVRIAQANSASEVVRINYVK